MHQGQDIAVLKRFRHPLECGGITLFFGLLFCGSILHAEITSDDQCLRCHGEASIKQVQPDGRIRSLYVDPEQWQADVHRGKGFACVDCHTEVSSFSHPVGGFQAVDCAACHSEECETFTRTVHASISSTGKETVSGCYDCHAKHSVRSKEDPEASVGPKHIASTCSSCHADEAASSSWINRLTFFRISGHKKENVSQRYDMSQCLHCHFEEGAHGQPSVLAERCATCHKKDAGISGVFSRSVHAAAVFGGGGVVAGMKILYGLILCGVFGFIAIVSLRKITGSKRKRKEPAA